MQADPGAWRSHQIWSSVRWFILYSAVGLTVLSLTLRFVPWPWNLVGWIGGPVTDAILLVGFYRLVRVWDNRVWHAAGSDPHLDDPIAQCTQRKGRWRCAGMNGHDGPHLFGIELGRCAMHPFGRHARLPDCINWTQV
jgi:hypothetical protein